MRKTILLAGILLLASTLVKAEEKRPYIEAGGVVGYNETWKGYGGVELKGGVPLGKIVNLRGAVEYLSPDILSGTVVVRPEMKLWKGTAYVDGSVNCRNYSCYDTRDFSLSLSIGYDLEYILVQGGFMGHSFISGKDRVKEPFNLLYCGELRLRRSDSKWNISAGGANFTDFEYERTWEPMYFLKGRVDLSNNFTLLVRGDLKPAGAFHMNANFWGISLRVGMKYKF